MDARLRVCGWGAALWSSSMQFVGSLSGGIRGQQSVPLAEPAAVSNLLQATEGPLVIVTDCLY
eukprot:7767379-Pyramimonas_sp.AAC.1